MIVKKNITKYSIEYNLVQGDKVFKFIEYTDGNTDFSKRGEHIGLGYIWSPATNKNITNIKDAKKFVRNREYL